MKEPNITMGTRQRFSYEPWSDAKALGPFAFGMLLCGVMIILRSPSLAESIVPLGGLAIFVTGVLLIVLWKRQWWWGPPRQTITIDPDRQEVVFEWFRIFQAPSARIGWQSSKVVPRLIVDFEDILDLFHFGSGRFSTPRRMDYLTDRSRLRLGGMYLVVTSRGSVSIPMAGLEHGADLISKLLEMTPHSPPAPLSTNFEFRNSLWTGIGLSVAGLILAVLGWDVESSRWVIVLMLIGGAGKLLQAWRQARTP